MVSVACTHHEEGLDYTHYDTTCPREVERLRVENLLVRQQLDDVENAAERVLHDITRDSLDNLRQALEGKHR